MSMVLRYTVHLSMVLRYTVHLSCFNETVISIRLHSKYKFVGLTMMFVMWGSLCQAEGLAFIHDKHLLSCQNCIVECY